mgnify:FL=1
MHFMHFIYISIIILLILYIITTKCSEGLSNKPNQADIINYTSDIMQNREIFGSRGTFYNARNKMPWIDPILYEDARMLAMRNNLNNESVMRIFY